MNALATVYAFIAALYTYVFLYRPRMDRFYNQLTPAITVSQPERMDPQPLPYMPPMATENQTLTTYIAVQPDVQYPLPVMTPSSVPPSLVPPVIGPLLGLADDTYREEPFGEYYKDLE